MPPVHNAIARMWTASTRSQTTIAPYRRRCAHDMDRAAGMAASRDCARRPCPRSGVLGFAMGGRNGGGAAMADGMTDPSETGATGTPIQRQLLLAVFTRIGLTSFGGGMSGWLMREFVQRRRWMDEEEFLAGLGLAQAFPGVNVVNMAIWIGYRLRGNAGRAGWRVRHRRAAGAAGHRHRRLVHRPAAQFPLTHLLLNGVGAAAVGLVAADGAGGGAPGGAQGRRVHPGDGRRLRRGRRAASGRFRWCCWCSAPLSVGHAYWTARPCVACWSSWRLLFAPLSLLSVGGGQTLVAEIHRQVVTVHHWMTEGQFVDAFAISRMAPGPGTLLVTLIGWQVAGGWGALVASHGDLHADGAAGVRAGPASGKRFRGARWQVALEAGLRPVASGMILAAGLVLVEALEGGWLARGIAVLSTALLLRTAVNPIVLMAGGAGCFVLLHGVLPS